MGDRVGARADYDLGLNEARSGKSPTEGLGQLDPQTQRPKGAFEGARALYARGVLLIEAGDIDGACADLDEALAVTLELRKLRSILGYTPPEQDVVSLEGVIRRARSACARAKNEEP